MEYLLRLWQLITDIKDILIYPADFRFSTFFTNPDNIWAALFIGTVWGFVLQKTTICKYDVVLKFLTFKDLTVHKVGVPLIISAMIMIHLLYDLGIIHHLVIPRTIIAGQIIGGLIFGIGAAISGYCPGTSACALGEGSLDTLFFMLGMVAGSAAYAEVYPFLKNTILSMGNLGSATLTDLLGIDNHWYIIVYFVIVAVILETIINFKEKKILKGAQSLYRWIFKTKC
jgi:uncharacterized membrane protein YedE/YeeE